MRRIGATTLPQEVRIMRYVVLFLVGAFIGYYGMYVVALVGLIWGVL